MDAVAVCSDVRSVGLAVAVGVAQLPEVGDAGVPDVAAAGQHAGADAVGRVVEAVGEDGRGVGLAVAVAVLDQPDAVVLDRVDRRTALPRYFRYIATRSATVRQARSSSSQFMWPRVSVTPAWRRNVSAT